MIRNQDATGNGRIALVPLPVLPFSWGGRRQFPSPAQCHVCPPSSERSTRPSSLTA